MKKIFKKRSKLFIVVIILESILTIWALIYFNYMDHLNYYESVASKTQNLALMIQNMFTSTWWALIILDLALITIFSLVAIIYRDLKFQFISICLWVILLILAINFKDTLRNNLATILIFIPIFTLNILAYKEQKKLNS
jgi:hypothetical protein